MPRQTMPPMDSVTQIALGAAMGVAVMGRRSAPWKAAVWGAVAGTLPDLDVLIDHGDPILNMVLHRAETHAPFWLTLFSLPFAAVVARLHGEWDRWRRWWLALWLALVTHPLLDAMTVYGTQIALPFSDQPYGVGSMFIIDPLYTLPLLAGTLWALLRNGRGHAAAGPGLRANHVGLILSSAYLVWSVAAQMHVERIARQALAAQGIAAERLLVLPTAFNTLLWRVVAIDGQHYLEGFHSVFDRGTKLHLDRFDRGTRLGAELRSIDGVRRIQNFSHGFWAVWQQDERLGITDLRMGQEPAYTFRFAVAERHSPWVPLVRSEQVGGRPDVGRVLPWLWRRALGEPLPPPR